MSDRIRGYRKMYMDVHRICLSGFVAPQVPGEAAGPGFSLSDPLGGLGDGLDFDPFGSRILFEISRFERVCLFIDLGSQDWLQDESDTAFRRCGRSHARYGAANCATSIPSIFAPQTLIIEGMLTTASAPQAKLSSHSLTATASQGRDEERRRDTRRGKES